MTVHCPLESARPLACASEPRGLRLAGGTIVLSLKRDGAGPVSAQPETPLLLFRFTPERRSAGDAFMLLAPDGPAVVNTASPAEVLAAACSDHKLAPGAADGRWRRDAGVRALAHELRRALLEAQAPAERYLEHLVRAMFLRAEWIARERDDRAASGLPAARLQRVLDEIDARMGERLTVEHLAQVAGMSRARFAEAFRRSVGNPPYAYLRERRVQAVRAALDSGEQNLARLAARFGFSSHAHMTTAFVAAFGLTPSAYRRALTGVGAQGEPPSARGDLRSGAARAQARREAAAQALPLDLR